jgi:hypothetical protein
MDTCDFRFARLYGVELRVCANVYNRYMIGQSKHE